MIDVIAVVAPVFVLIAVGFGAGKLGYVSEGTGKAVSEFTFLIAMPALLFRTMATTALPDVAPLALWTSYFGSAGVLWLATALHTAVVLGRPANDAAVICFSATYGNIVMLGIPLASYAFGPAAMAYSALLISIHSPLFCLTATLHMGLAGRSADTSAMGLARTLLLELARNPILLAILLGSFWRISGLSLPGVADRSLALLGQAGIPSALVALGLGLTSFRIAGQVPTLISIVVAKNVLMPLLAWVLAARVLALPPTGVGVVTLFAAMPTGANAYLFATRHGRAVHSTSGAVALGTALSALIAAFIVYALKPEG